MRKIENERICIRKIEENDASALHELFCDEDAMRFVSLYPPFNKMEETIERTNEWSFDEEHYAILDKASNQLVGYIAINPDSEEDREDTRELGYAIIEKYRRNGYMFEAIQLVLDKLKSEKIKYVWACTFDGNIASYNLIKKLGFKLMGTGTYEVENDKEYTSYEFRIKL